MASTGEAAGRVSALDGLRGLAVGLVLVGHYLLVAPLGVPYDTAAAFGDLGVTAFFVLSGWLITTILVRELGYAGRISIRDFYRRRTLRIFPALYTYLAALGLLAMVGAIDLTPTQLLLGGSFTMNYAPLGGAPWILHLWSLAVEEQFYLLWPALLVALRPRWAFALAVVVVGAAPLVRDMLPGDPVRMTVYLHTRGDSLLTGAALALLPVVAPVVYARLSRLLARPVVARVAVTVLAVSFAASCLLGVDRWLVPLGWTVNNLAVAALIGAMSTGAMSGVRTMLEAPWLVRLGVMSYSVYLWQEMFLNSDTARVFITWPVGIVAAVVAGWLSWRFVETPFLRIKSPQVLTSAAPTGAAACRTARTR